VRWKLADSAFQARASIEQHGGAAEAAACLCKTALHSHMHTAALTCKHFESSATAAAVGNMSARCGPLVAAVQVSAWLVAVYARHQHHLRSARWSSTSGHHLQQKVWSINYRTQVAGRGNVAQGSYTAAATALSPAAASATFAASMSIVLCMACAWPDSAHAWHHAVALCDGQLPGQYKGQAITTPVNIFLYRSCLARPPLPVMCPAEVYVSLQGIDTD
jgi:hypothetical protein